MKQKHYRGPEMNNFVLFSQAVGPYSRLVLLAPICHVIGARSRACSIRNVCNWTPTPFKCHIACA